MGLFEACADVGDSIITFFRKSRAHAAVIAVLCFISPVNIAMWLLVLAALWRRKR